MTNDISKKLMPQILTQNARDVLYKVAMKLNTVRGEWEQPSSSSVQINISKAEFEKKGAYIILLLFVYHSSLLSLS